MTMDLILWRHAEAQDESDGVHDLERPLTARGEKQAAKLARWLDMQLPDNARILCSPALRCEQTVLPLGRKYELREELAPDLKPSGLLQAAGWPDSRESVLVVGHQPVLGQVIARLIGLKGDSCPVRKGAVWWLRTRERDGHQQTVVLAVQSPDVL
jgi:phosphohistidine phosphatase